jgi:hypothetical protein
VLLNLGLKYSHWTVFIIQLANAVYIIIIFSKRGRMTVEPLFEIFS